MCRSWLVVILATVLGVRGGLAQDATPTADPATTTPAVEQATGNDEPVRFHAFVSQGALLSTDNNYLAKTKRGSLEFTEAGLNVTKTLDDQLSMGMQLFMRDLGPEGNYSAKLDWLYLDYRWRDWLALRAGRVKVPFGLFNDTSDIDAALPVVLLPQAVYPVTNRNFLLAQTGVELHGYLPLTEGGETGALDYRAYFGTLYLSLPDSSDYQVENLDVPFVTGGRVLWETPLEGLRVGGSLLAGKLSTDITFGGMVTSIASTGIQWLGSVEYNKDALGLALEYGRSHNKQTIDGMTNRSTSENGYAMASYRWRPWLQTSAYYSLRFANVDNRSGRENHQHDAALTFRFDITPNWVAKLELHSLRGTASLDPSLNDDVQRADLTNIWWLGAVKTTVYF